MLIAFIRHGEYAQPERTPSAWLPQPLTAAGVEQSRLAARQLAGWVKQRGLLVHSVVDSSRLRRAWQTATIFCEELNADLGSTSTLSVEQFDDLAERGVGAFANLTVDQIEAHVADDPRFDALPEGWKSNSHFRLPAQGAESLMEAGERVARHVTRRVEGLEQNTLKLFIGHGAALRHGAHLLGLMPLADIAKHSMFYAHPVVYEGRLGELALVQGQWKVRESKDRID